MELDELSEGARAWVRTLRHGSSTVENDIMDVLTDTASEHEFLEQASHAMCNVMAEVGEALWQLEYLKGLRSPEVLCAGGGKNRKGHEQDGTEKGSH